MKAYIILIDECVDSDSHSYIEGVYTTKELAKKAFDEIVADEKADTEYDTIEETETTFEAYNEGWYLDNHYTVSIEEEEIKGEDNELIIEDVMLVDDSTATGGKANDSETLTQFVLTGWAEIENGNDSITLKELNEELIHCGIEPITDEQIVIKGVKNA